MCSIQSHSLQFVLIGPKEGDDRVLVRSSNASVELIGFAASLGLGEHGAVYPQYDSDHTDGDMHSVSTNPIDAPPNQSDRRKSSYRFCWMGKCGKEDHADIEKKLKTHIQDIKDALLRAKNQTDTTEVEWALAPIPYACAAANSAYKSNEVAEFETRSEKRQASPRDYGRWYTVLPVVVSLFALAMTGVIGGLWLNSLKSVRRNDIDADLRTFVLLAEVYGDIARQLPKPHSNSGIPPSFTQAERNAIKRYWKYVYASWYVIQKIDGDSFDSLWSDLYLDIGSNEVANDDYFYVLREMKSQEFSAGRKDEFEQVVGRLRTRLNSN